MNKLVLTLCLVGTFSFASIESDLRKEMPGLTNACINKMFTKAESMCNRDSKDDPSREHNCYLDEVTNIRSATDNMGSFVLNYTVIDADVYQYIVKVSNVMHCKFQISSNN